MEGVTLMKRNVLVTSILVLFLIPAFVMAANSDKFIASKAVSSSSDELVVPLEVTNTQKLAAMDIPLGFSEGATLQEVVFTDRVKGFEYTIANIDNENRQVVIGLISMVSKELPDLDVGSGPIAELHFKLDEGVKGVEIKAIELENPNHSLTYYYNDYSSGRPEVKSIHPEFETQFVELKSAIPDVYALHQNSPNPFNPITAIKYDMPKAGDVQISVFNVLGQRVTDLVNGYQEAGSHEVVWNGKDDGGSSVASGIYFYRIKTSEFSDTKKMLLLK
jgi:hypothetical protein